MAQIGDIEGFFPKKLGEEEVFVRPVIINKHLWGASQEKYGIHK